MALDLTALGWSPRLEELFAPHAAASLLPARVSLEHTHIYRVLAADGEILARVAGRLRHRAAERADSGAPPAPGREGARGAGPARRRHAPRR